MEIETSLAAQLDVCAGRIFALRTALETVVRGDSTVSDALERDYASWLASSASDAFLGGFEEEADEALGRAVTG